MGVSRRALLASVPAAWLASAGIAVAAPMSFQVPMRGAEEVPPVHTSATATAHLTYNPSTREVTWRVTYSGLKSPVTMAHFHGPAPRGKNAPVEIWLSKKGQPVSSPITGHATLSPAQAKQFMAGDWYVNVHTKDHPAGALRGQVMPPKA